MDSNPSEGVSDDFLDQILGIHPFTGAESGSSITMDGGGLAGNVSPMMLQLNSAHGGGGSGFYSTFPLGLSLEQGRTGFLKQEEASASGNRFREEVIGGRGSSLKNTFHGQPLHNTVATVSQPPVIRPRVRARRGQATDPHSIAERLRREKIAERIRGLQELVPSVNKTDRAAMLDEIVDYVKFLRLQVKVLSMSRLGGAGAVAPLVTDIPISSVEEEGGERRQGLWEKWSKDGTEEQVAKLMEENIGAAMQFLQSKALCIMPISLASAIYPAPETLLNPQTNPPPP